MKVLIIGNGGREHALAWKSLQSNQVEQVYVAPGNPGTAALERCENVPISPTDIESLLTFARTIDLTIVGPEAPLAAGIVDQFTEAGFPCFGPTQAAAQLESSKTFAKHFMQKHGIPTAEAESFENYEAALAYIQEKGTPIVIKADGLAAGKGVVIATTEEEAIHTLNDFMRDKKLGGAGGQVLIESFLEGEEASFIALCDGEDALPLASSQDHKARDEGDRGPNTGGMGAYSPAPVVTPEREQQIMDQIIKPTLRGLVEAGTPYRGFLYAGLMISPQGDLRVLEFNCRLGDPETQPLMMRLNSDLVALCQAALQGKLAEQTIDWDPRPALGVVLCAEGYPSSPKKGDPIQGLDQPLSDAGYIFQAGTAFDDNQNIVTQGGRVLCATALGNNLNEAKDLAYAIANNIAWPGCFYRRDIGYRACQS